MTMSTYKSLGGPAGGLIVTNDAALAERLDAIAFPGMTANFDAAKSAALAVTMLDWRDFGAAYAAEMIAMARALAEAMIAEGLPVYRPERVTQIPPVRARGRPLRRRPGGVENLRRAGFSPRASACRCPRSGRRQRHPPRHAGTGALGHDGRPTRAAQPADERHPYGHHKAEFFSAVLEGAMIIVAALIIFHEAWTAFQNPRPLDAPVEGLFVNWLASVINGVWCWVLISRGRKHRSPALVADGYHLLSDVVSSVGVTLGVLLAIVTGWHVLDPALAALVALNILWSGWKVMKSSLSGLLDEAVPDETLERIREIISDKASGAIEAHDLRTRHAGAVTFIEFHLVVDGQTTVLDAHDICDRIEAAIRKEVSDARVTIHVEPEDKAKHKGVIVV
jgi:cation diffusion facilitator family transporter